jgi:hypothetical protein
MGELIPWTKLLAVIHLSIPRESADVRPPVSGSVSTTDPSGDLERENQRLRRELACTQRQREILKKALAICSAQPELLGDSH